MALVIEFFSSQPMLNESLELLPVTSTAAQGEAIVPALMNWSTWESSSACRPLGPVAGLCFHK